MTWLLLLPLITTTPVRDVADFWIRYGIASSIVAATDDPDEQRVLMRIAWFESRFRPDVIECRVLGDHGASYGVYQVQPRGRRERKDACGTLDQQTALAIGRVRESMRVCAHMPKAERLGIYTDGKCDTAKAKRQSRERWGSP